MKKRNQRKILLAILLALMADNVYADSIPFLSITINKKIVYNDSIPLNSKTMTIFYCDSFGIISDTFTGIYRIKYKKFIVIYNVNCLKVPTRFSDCEIDLKLKKLKYKNYLRRLFQPYKYHDFTLRLCNYMYISGFIKKNTINYFDPCFNF